MPPSKEDIEFQRKIDAFRKATEGLIVPGDGQHLLAKLLAEIAAHNERAA